MINDLQNASEEGPESPDKKLQFDKYFRNTTLSWNFKTFFPRKTHLKNSPCKQNGKGFFAMSN